MAVIALLIGAVGIGLGVYTIFLSPTNSNNSSTIIDIWTLEQPYGDFLSDDYRDFAGGMWINISVSANITLLIVFNVEFSCSGSGSSTNEYLQGGVRILLDGVEIDGSEREFYTSTTEGDVMQQTLTTQVVVEDILAGTHEIRVQAKAEASIDESADHISDGLLVIYAYK